MGHGVVVDVDVVCRETVEMGSNHSNHSSHITRRQWEDLSYQHGAKEKREQRKKKALARGLDVDAIITSIPTAKTCNLERFEEHIKGAVASYDRLYAYYKQDRPTRWKVYKRGQKAMHQLCMKVIGMCCVVVVAVDQTLHSLVCL